MDRKGVKVAFTGYNKSVLSSSFAVIGKHRVSTAFSPKSGRAAQTALHSNPTTVSGRHCASTGQRPLRGLAAYIHFTTSASQKQS